MQGVEIDAANKSTISQGNYKIYGECGGNHKFSCQKFRCFKFGEKGHVHRDCKKEQICFHSRQSGHVKSSGHA